MSATYAPRFYRRHAGTFFLGSLGCYIYLKWENDRSWKNRRKTADDEDIQDADRPVNDYMKIRLLASRLHEAIPINTVHVALGLSGKAWRFSVLKPWLNRYNDFESHSTTYLNPPGFFFYRCYQNFTRIQTIRCADPLYQIRRPDLLLARVKAMKSFAACAVIMPLVLTSITGGMVLMWWNGKR